MLVVLENMVWFVGLVLLQVLVLSHVHILGYATPFFFIYFLLRYDSGVGRSTLMLWGFFLGLFIDIFCNTPGINAAAATLMAFVRGPIIRLVTLKEMEENFAPSIPSMGFSSYFKYVLICTLIFCCVVEMMETFSFFNWQQLGLRIISDLAITLVCIFCAEAIRRRK
ncbi:rod shape-determining protein MreD [Phocaeicola oris]|uniref:rod shape-determining protein MreD n=2 Tax=Phocaeicola TaxID=909656 RepID=UPI00234EDC3C|nr:rod shape-determining protein MreD [Phocaeicola oris]MCE2615992.1 rod shape-determining protein MreD [Phocaeicola oris]